MLSWNGLTVSTEAMSCYFSHSAEKSTKLCEIGEGYLARKQAKMAKCLALLAICTGTIILPMLICHLIDHLEKQYYNKH